MLRNILKNVNSRKLRFLLASALLVGFSYYLFSRDELDYALSFRDGLLLVAASLLGSALVHLFDMRNTKVTLLSITEILLISVLPVLFTLSSYMSFEFFPNLASFIRILEVLFFISMIYTVFLVNNVCLVVRYKGGSIPVYRAAVGWVQIILLSAVITISTNIFKLNFNIVYQSLLLGLVVAILTIYMFWVYSFDTDVRKINRVETLVLLAAAVVLTTGSGVAVSFIPAENFLRGLCVSASMMGISGYIQTVLKNSISKKIIIEYSIIYLVFLFILLVFRP